MGQQCTRGRHVNHTNIMHSTGLYQGNNKKIIDVCLITMLWPSMNGYVFSTLLDRRMIGNYVEVVVVCFKKLS
jgi:hypothetical protein